MARGGDGEGTTTFFVAPAPWGSLCSGTSDDCLSLLCQGDPMPVEICPPVPGMPSESYLTYEGSAGGAPFSGAAPAGQCQNMTGGP